MSTELEAQAHADLEAAQRTVSVLKDKVRAMYNGSQSAFARQLEAARRREEETTRRRELTELRAAALQKYSEDLEREVARRTLAMRRVLSNVTFGCLIVDRDLIVQPECTDSCARLFATTRVEGVSFIELLRLENTSADAYRFGMEQLFADELLTEASLAQLQAEFKIGASTIRVEGSVLRDATQTICSVLFTVSDITALLAAQAEAKSNRTLISILRSKASFRRFLTDVSDLLASAHEAVAAGDTQRACRAIHTIKGNCGCYDLEEIATLVHQVEEIGVDERGVAAIRAEFTAFLEQNFAVLGIRMHTDDEVYDVSQAQLSTLRLLASRYESDELSRLVAKIGERPASLVLGPIESLASRVGERVGKRVTMTVKGGDTLVDEARFRPIAQTVSHLIRNAIDHGIEAPEDRGEKNATGALKVEISADARSLVLRLEDDGAGIDTDRLVEAAVARGTLTKEAASRLAPSDRLQLIFEDGVSCATDVTPISGRGVGMSAVRAAVREAGGTLSLSSERGRGTTFVIELPHEVIATRATRTSSRVASLPPIRRSPTAPPGTLRS